MEHTQSPAQGLPICQLHIPGASLQNIILPALIDLHAADIFIDAAAAQIRQIPLQCKVIPDLVETLGSSPLSSGPVTEEKTPLETVI